MIVRSEDFEIRHPEWIQDDSLPEDLKATLQSAGMAESMNRVECLDIVDECFKCGRKLTTPYVYWNGAAGSISLHPDCATKLALGIVQDAHELATGTRGRSASEAVKWLRSTTQDGEYGRDAV